MLILLQKMPDLYLGNSLKYLVDIYACGLELSLTGQNISSNSIIINTSDCWNGIYRARIIICLALELFLF